MDELAPRTGRRVVLVAVSYGLVLASVIALGSRVASDLRARPCTGDPVPELITELATTSAVDLPLVARPVVESEHHAVGCLTSYAPSGTDTLSLGPFVVEESWTQTGNDAHPLGPRNAMKRLHPADINVDSPLWGRPFFNGPDYGGSMGMELHRTVDGNALVLLTPYLYGGSDWAAVTLPPIADRPPLSAITFRVVHHPAGHRAFTAGRIAPHVLLLVVALVFTLWTRRRSSATPAPTSN